MQFNGKPTLTLYPFILHSLSLSVFSSVIGPFGGFFASGFKRAFKIKVIESYINDNFISLCNFTLVKTGFYNLTGLR